MNSKLCKTLEGVFSRSVQKGLEWARIESLFLALGAELIEGRGSRVHFVLNGVVGTFHRLHPAKEAKPYPVRDAGDLAGITL